MLRRHWFFAALIVALPLITLLHNLVNFYSNCYNAIDISIYQQAIYDFSWKDLNPYLTIRNVQIFNDHIEPILLALAPIAWLTNYHPAMVLVFEWMTYIATLMLVFFYAKKHYDSWNSVFYILFFVVFCKLYLKSLDFPVHPVTWSVPILILLGIAIYNKQNLHIYLLSLALLTTRELYAHCIFFMSFYFLFKKNWKLTFPLMATGLAWILFDYNRETILGPTLGYGPTFIKNLTSNPIDFVIQKLKSHPWSGYAKFYVPMLIPYGAILWNFKKIKNENFKDVFYALSFLSAPALGLYILTNSIDYHYGAQFAGAFIAIFLIYNLNQNLNKTTKIVTMILVIVSGMSVYDKAFRKLTRGTNQSCQVSAAKFKANKEIQNLVKQLVQPEDKLLSTGGVIPMIMRPDFKIFHLAGMSPRTGKSDYILLETQFGSIQFPLRTKEVLEIRELCRPYATEIIKDTEFYFFAKGEFPDSCSNKHDVETLQPNSASQ